MRTWRVPTLLLVSLLLAGRLFSADQDKEITVGTVALYQGNYRLAAALSQKYVNEHPNSAAGRILLGQVLTAFGRYEQAFSELREALRLEPDNTDALYFLGKVSLILGQVEFQKLQEMAPDSARVHQLLGESYELQNKKSEAEQEYRAALEADPGLIEALNALGDLKRSQLECEEASSYYSRAAAIDPDNYDSAYGLGACQLYSDRPKRAIEFFRRALSIDPDSAAASFALGKALMDDRQLEEAATELKRAVALEPRMRQGYTLLGRIYQELGRQEDAREAFQKSRELFQAEMDDVRRRFESPDLIRIDDAGPAPDGGKQEK